MANVTFGKAKEAVLNSQVAHSDIYYLFRAYSSSLSLSDRSVCLILVICMISVTAEVAT